MLTVPPRLLSMLAALMLFAGTAPAQITEGDDGPLRFARFEADGKIRHGFLSVGGIHELSGGFFEKGIEPTGKVFKLNEVRLLAPVVPGKVIGVAFNYPDNPGARRGGEPLLFAKFPSALIGPDETIVPPAGSSELHFEGELVIVIGARASKVAAGDADKVVMGVTIGNDITEHGFGRSPFALLQAKSGDRTTPLGPWIVPGLSYDRLGIETKVNGKRVQHGSTRRMIRSIGAIIAAVTRHFTLEPGDVIYTGTPGRTTPLKPGDVIEVSIEGIGTLRNTVGKLQ